MEENEKNDILIVKNEILKQVDNFCVERIFCYETKNFLHIIGSSNCGRKFRAIKIDRKFRNSLVIQDNQRILNQLELDEYLKIEGIGNSGSARVGPTVAFGIVGFVRFLEGYYLILIVKRRCVGLIGRHCVYRIEDTSMLYIPNEEHSNNEENRYLKIFSNVDLKSDFYFSYSYDLSNSLQFNLAPPRKNENHFQCGFGHSTTLWESSEAFLRFSKYDDFKEDIILLKPNMKYVWNEYLLSPLFQTSVHNDFFLYIIHGFVSQAVLPISGRNLVMTLIARRSKMYAGTRFLKRGATREGFTANEVETEQIIHDGNNSSFLSGLFSSFVQIRGSIPTYWSQNIAKHIAPKPQIVVDLKDPFFQAAGAHMNALLYEYGSPAIILNLVKRKEKRPHESILFNEFEQAIEYLNQFVPKQHQITLIAFDMARNNKMKDQNVIKQLSEIGVRSIKKTGFFLNRSTVSSLTTEYHSNQTQHQTGIVRVNCVDCLDRTNTAQFAIGRIALAYQLHAMGALYVPELDLDSDIVRLLEELYEDHGDTIALQYGGSQLVHRIKTYRKTAPLTSQSKDIMQSLSRYYSNAFSDSDKQSAINLFLGAFQASRQRESLWNMSSDYSLHHHHWGILNDSHKKSYTKWWSDEVALCLPRAAREIFKDTILSEQVRFSKRIINFDWFHDVHRATESVNFVETYLFNMKKPKPTDQTMLAKLTNFRIQNRASLVGIPLNTSAPDEDEEISEDEDSCENDIIIRFETEPEVTDLAEVAVLTAISDDNNSLEKRHRIDMECDKNQIYRKSAITFVAAFPIIEDSRSKYYDYLNSKIQTSLSKINEYQYQQAFNFDNLKPSFNPQEVSRKWSQLSICI